MPRVNPASSESNTRVQVQRITEQALLAAGQLLVAGGLAIVWQYFANALGWGESWQYPLAPAGPQILDACVIAALGFFSAGLVVRLFPSASVAGRWVWLPPAALLAPLIGRNILLYGLDWHSISAQYFWAYPAQYLGPIGRDILTYPALSASAYSVGVQARILQSRRGGEGVIP